MRRKTVSRSSFGSSIPMAFLPGTTATRAEIALIDRAISSAREITRDDLTPGAGSISNKVITGPGRTSLIRPRTPNSFSTSVRRAAFSSKASSSTVSPRSSGIWSRSMEGRRVDLRRRSDLVTRGWLGAFGFDTGTDRRRVWMGSKSSSSSSYISSSSRDVSSSS